MKWITLLVIIILGLLQVTVLDYFKVFGIKPDLLLASVVLASLYLELKWVLGLGIFAGSLKDIFSANPLGLNTLLFPLWIFLIINLSRKISIDKDFIRAILIFIIVFFNNIIARIILLLLGKFIPWGVFLRIAFLESFYTAFVSPLVFRVIRAAVY